MIRYLDSPERVGTRKMWEDIFSSDSKEFLDYYYTEKIKANQILITEERILEDLVANDFLQAQEVSANSRKIRAMLQLNPYKIFLKGQVVSANYIVGVATDSNHRHQGHMKNLLIRALNDMYQKKEAFTYLMPAAEAIYKPFDFRFIYNQKACLIKKESLGKLIGNNENKASKVDLICRPGKEKDIFELVDFSNELLSIYYQLYTYRNQEYYQMLLKELASEKGEILLFYHKNQLLGYCFYAIGEAVEVREPVCKDGYEKEFMNSLLQSLAKYKKDIKLSGIYVSLADKLDQEGSEYRIVETPMIMARIVNFKDFISRMKAKDILDVKIQIRDPIISENNQVFHLFTREKDAYIEVKVTNQNPDTEFNISDLTSFLLGYKRLNELEEFDYLKTDKLVLNDLEKLFDPGEIFINEVV